MASERYLGVIYDCRFRVASMNISNVFGHVYLLCISVRPHDVLRGAEVV